MAKAINQRRQNNTMVGAALHYGTRQDDLAAYESLPGNLRRVIDENATKLSAETVVLFLQSMVRQGMPGPDAVHHTIRKIRSLEVGEISVFAGRYQSQFGHELPHTAAAATIQRYGASGPSRRGARRRPHIRGFGILDIPEVA